MNFRLKKIENISELIVGKTYMSFTRDISEAIEKHDINSSIPIKVIKKSKLDVVEIQIALNKSIVTQDMLNEYMNIYSIQIVDFNDSETTDKEVINLKRQIRKLEKKNAKLNGVLSKHNIDLNEHKNFAAKKNNNKTMRITNTYREDLFGYDVFVVIKTNEIDKVEVTISLDACINTHNETMIKDKIVVKGIAIKHKDDIFNYRLGKQLAYARAINKLMERIVQE